jgi:hypothetical protein
MFLNNMKVIIISCGMVLCWSIMAAPVVMVRPPVFVSPTVVMPKPMVIPVIPKINNMNTPRNSITNSKSGVNTAPSSIVKENNTFWTWLAMFFGLNHVVSDVASNPVTEELYIDP